MSFRPFQANDSSHSELEQRPVLVNEQKARQQSAQVRQMTHEHYILCSRMEAHPQRRNIVVRRHTGNLFETMLRLQSSAKNFCCLASTQFLAVLIPIHRNTGVCQITSHVRDEPASLIVEATLRVLGFTLACSVLN